MNKLILNLKNYVDRITLKICEDELAMELGFFYAWVYVYVKDKVLRYENFMTWETLGKLFENVDVDKVIRSYDDEDGLLVYTIYIKKEV